MVKYLKPLLYLFLVVIVLAFFSENNETLSQSIVLRFDAYFIKWKSIPIHLYLVILVSFLVGGLFTVAYLFGERMRMKGKVKESKRQQEILEEELNSLRNMPLEDKVFSRPALTSSPSISAISTTHPEDEEKTIDPSINGE